MTDPLAFLTAALDAAQRDAEAAAAETGAPGWHGSDSGLYSDDASNHPGPFLADAYGYTAPELVAHIARHDPASVLRRIAADRKLIERCLAVLAEEDRLKEDVGGYLAEDAIRYLAEGWGWTEETT